MLFYTQMVVCSENYEQQDVKKKYRKLQPTILIQVEIVLVTELLRATSEEYIVVSEEVLKAGDLVKRVTMILEFNVHFIKKTILVN